MMAWTDPSGEMTVKELTKRYLERLDRVNTVTSYRATFAGFAATFGDRNIFIIKASEIRIMLEGLPVSKQTKYVRFTHIKALFNYAIKVMRADGFEGPIGNPCNHLVDDFKKPRINGEPVPGDIDARVKLFLASLESKPAYHLMALIGIRSALRVSEILRLTPADLIRHSEYGYLRIRDPKSRANLELRYCPIEIITSIKEFIDSRKIKEDEKIFGKTRQAVYNKFKKLGFEPHDLRRYAAFKAQSLGIPLKSIQGLLGHASVLTTTRYLQDLSPIALADSLRPLEGVQL